MSIPEDTQEVVKYGWWCPECQTWVDSTDVTFEETHDTREGGCGERVESRELEQTKATEADIVARLREPISKVSGYQDPLNIEAADALESSLHIIKGQSDEIERLRKKVDALRIVVMNAQSALGAGDVLPHDEHVLAKRITSARRYLNG